MADDFLAETLAEAEEELEAAEQGGESVDTAELLRQLISDNRAANEDLIRRVTGGAAGPQRGVPLQADDPLKDLEFSLEGLPDPAIDPAAFHKGYAERARVAVGRAIQTVEQRAAAHTQRVLSDKQVLDNTNAMLKAANPNLTDEVIGMASGVIAARLQAAGRNPMDELKRDTEGVAQQILDYTDELASQLAGGRRAAHAPQPANRARGLVSGRNRVPAPPRQADKDAAAKDPLALYKDLQEIQRKARIY